MARLIRFDNTAPKAANGRANGHVNGKRYAQVSNAQKLQFERAMQDLTLNVMTSRLEWLKSMNQDRRDVDEECRYPTNITPFDYKKVFDRNGPGTRCVTIEPEESWVMPPQIYDSEDAEETEFEAAIKSLNEESSSIRLFSYMHKGDVLSGIGAYGVLLLGVDDGKPLNEPIDSVPETGRLEDITKQGRNQVIFIRALDQSLCNINQWESDTQNPRYGMPKMYTLNLIDPGVLQQGLQGDIKTLQSSDVHWSRVVHLADNKLSSEVFGTPRLLNVYDLLLNVKKILGANGEGFWQSAFPGLSFETQQGLENIDVDIPALREMAMEYLDGLQRALFTSGMNVKPLAGAPSDPGPSFETQCKAIALSKGIPWRIFMGSEEAKLASVEDRASWANRMARRCIEYVSPQVIRPVVDRFIMIGSLPIPLDGVYTIHWNDLNAPSDDAIASTALKKTQAMQAYVSGGVDALIDPADYLTIILQMDPDEVETIMSNSMQRQADEAAGKDILMGGPTEAEIRAEEQQKVALKMVGKKGGQQFGSKQPTKNVEVGIKVPLYSQYLARKLSKFEIEAVKAIMQRVAKQGFYKPVDRHTEGSGHLKDALMHLLIAKVLKRGNEGYVLAKNVSTLPITAKGTYPSVQLQGGKRARKNHMSALLGTKKSRKKKRKVKLPHMEDE